MIPLFDSHAHLSSPELLPHIGEILKRSQHAGVEWIANICTDLETLREGIKLAQNHKGICNVGATTPHDAETEGEANFSVFEEAARGGLLAAIGETGLDYHYANLDKGVQQKFLRRYLRLAAELKLPVVFHCREAFADLFSIADSEYPKGAPAILHCFTGTMEEAEQVWQRGWLLSLSGIVTFKKSEALRRVAKEAPINQLLIETDAPYLAPQSKRGKMNEPAFVGEIAACIAAARGESVEHIAKMTKENGIRVFHLSN